MIFERQARSGRLAWAAALQRSGGTTYRYESFNIDRTPAGALLLRGRQPVIARSSFARDGGRPFLDWRCAEVRSEEHS